MNNDLNWFIDRIGNIVYRKTISFNKQLNTITLSSWVGIRIQDKQHAIYLYSFKEDLFNESGLLLTYIDTNPLDKQNNETKIL